MGKGPVFISLEQICRGIDGYLKGRRFTYSVENLEILADINTFIQSLFTIGTIEEGDHTLFEKVRARLFARQACLKTGVRVLNLRVVPAIGCAEMKTVVRDLRRDIHWLGQKSHLMKLPLDQVVARLEFWLKMVDQHYAEAPEGANFLVARNKIYLVTTTLKELPFARQAIREAHKLIHVAEKKPRAQVRRAVTQLRTHLPIAEEAA